MDSQTVTTSLCLACGLCCNGVLFKDVKLVPGDNLRALRQLGPLPSAGQRALPQPCAALCADNVCRIYANRPTRCRTFECALFKSVAAGAVTTPAALRIIHSTRRQTETVRRLLTKVGDTDETAPLRLRFRGVVRRLERSPCDPAVGAFFSKLTVAMHRLDMSLAQNFYAETSSARS